MLYHLFKWLEETMQNIPGAGVFQYVSFRAALSVIFSLLISLIIGKRIIRLLRRKLIGESIREDGPESHKSKAGTPTMGGLIIIAAILIPTLLWADLTNTYVLLILFSTIWMGLIGFVDDYIKVFKKNKAGLKGKFKIIGQVGLGLIVGFTMVFHSDFKGPEGRILDNQEIMLNETLRKNGFREGDKLLKVGNDEYAKSVSGTKDINSYTVIRTTQSGYSTLGKEVELKISPEQAEEVYKALFGYRYAEFQTRTNIPFVKNYEFNYSKIAFWEKEKEGIWGKLVYVLLVIIVVTAVSNGVNITDGLDGLAAGTTAITAVAIAIFAYVSGNIIFADYLNIAYIPEASELVVFCAALVGACVGFLWYNTHPAQIFMGDTGSLMLGGIVGTSALMIKKELLLPILCGIFFVESLSVILQVSWFRFTKRKYGEGRRIFKMAPLHHHFELKGLHESKIVVRFWIVATLLAVLAFVTLKLR